jgi:hypothetical protein
MLSGIMARLQRDTAARPGRCSWPTASRLGPVSPRVLHDPETSCAQSVEERGVKDRRSPDWQPRTSQILLSVENWIALARLFLRIDRFTLNEYERAEEAYQQAHTLYKEIPSGT